MKDLLTKNTTVADVLVACLEMNGIRTVFGVPGEETTDLMAAITASDLEFILCRHEQSAAFMASVHGRLTGRPAVCLATLGPGATNLLTGVADATLDHVPLIALTGQGSRDRLNKESHQIVDLPALFAPVTKSSRGLVVADEVPQAVAEAVRLAMAEKPGAVHLSLPEDLASASYQAEPVVAPHIPAVRAVEADLDRAAKVIDRACRPLIVAGHGVIRSGAAAEVRGLAERLGAPVLTTFMAKGTLPPDHPLNLHSLGQPQDDHADKALALADLIVAIGFDPVEYPPVAITPDGLCTVVQISETPPGIDGAWQVEAIVTGALGPNIAALAKRALAGESLDRRFAAVRDNIRSDLAQAVTQPDADAIAPQDICRLVSDVLSPGDVLLSGVGLHKLWVARNVIPVEPGQVIIPNGLAGMGLALPGAIEAARLRPHGRVFAICGDGDFLMNVQEMETAARLKLPITVMIWEDGGYGLIDEKQAQDGGGADGFAFSNPDWSSLATAFGWDYRDAGDLSALKTALEGASDAERPTLVRVPVDYETAGGMPGTDR